MDPEIQELRGRLDTLDAERRSINETAGDEALDADQQTRWDAIDTEEAEARTALAAAEERVARAERVAESRSRWNSLHVGTSVPTDDVDVRSLSGREARDRALKRADQAGELVELRDDQKEKISRLVRSRGVDSHGRETDTDGAQIARRLLLTENDDYRSAWVKAMTSATPAWTPEEARAVAAFRDFETRAMAEGANTSGGFGVPVLIDPTIILTAGGSLNPFRRISRVETITTNKWKGVSSAGVSWSYDAEAAEVSNDSPTLAQPEVPVHMARGFVPFSIEVAQDYPNFALEVGALLAEGYDELQAQSFAVGTGTGQPTGIVTALDADTNVEVVVTTDGALGAVDITKVWKALPDRAKANATWVMGAGTASDVAALGDAYGTRTSDLTGNLDRLRNRPVEPSSYIPDFAGVTTAQNLIVVGDFRKYLIAERAGMSVELVPHLVGTTNNRPTGQRGWFAYARHGANVIDIRAFRLLQNQ
jgi:HK97 family phage major capsid protein